MRTRFWTTLTCLATVVGTHIFFSVRYAYCAEPASEPQMAVVLCSR